MVYLKKKIVYRRKKIRRIVSAFETLICCIPVILKGLSQMKSANLWWFPPRKHELGELLLCMCYGIDRLLSLSEMVLSDMDSRELLVIVTAWFLFRY